MLVFKSNINPKSNSVSGNQSPMNMNSFSGQIENQDEDNIFKSYSFQPSQGKSTRNATQASHQSRPNPSQSKMEFQPLDTKNTFGMRNMNSFSEWNQDEDNIFKSYSFQPSQGKSTGNATQASHQSRPNPSQTKLEFQPLDTKNNLGMRKRIEEDEKQNFSAIPQWKSQTPNSETKFQKDNYL